MEVVMHCPCCGTYLRPTEYEGVVVHTCDGCGGEFLGGGELAHIVNTRDQRFSPVLRQALADRKPEFGLPSDTQRWLNCPSCRKPMQSLNYCGDSGIVVDRCDHCQGVWLDHEELEKVQIIMEQWEDKAPEQIKAISDHLEQIRRETAESTGRAFAGSRFAFVNALINRFLDAA
jgi:Zn-finger nucleic acid-binding protein